MLKVNILSRLRARAEDVKAEIADIKATAALAVEAKLDRIEQLEADLSEINNVVRGLPHVVESYKGESK